MKDRVPTYPGRVTLTPVAGQANTYDMARADQPTQEGTPLNKNTFLKDATAQALGLTQPDPSVDDAFNALSGVLNDGVFVDRQIKSNVLDIWDKTSLPFQLASICHSDNLFVAGAKDGHMWTSPDCKTWTKRTQSFVNYSGESYVVTGEGKFFVFPSSQYLSARNTGLYSNDGITWHEVSLPISDMYWSGAAIGKGTIVLSCGFGSRSSENRSGKENKLYYSTNNGETWNQASSDTAYWSDVTFDGEQFIAIRAFNSNNVVSISQDGITWTNKSVLPYSVRWTRIVNGDGILVALAGAQSSGPYYAKSTDGGNSWTSIGRNGYAIETSFLSYFLGKFWTSLSIKSNTQSLCFIDPDDTTWQDTGVVLAQHDGLLRPLDGAGYGDVALIGCPNNNLISETTYDDFLVNVNGGKLTIPGSQISFETGSYVGTGTYGSSNATSLSFSFNPKVLFISNAYFYNLLGLTNTSNSVTSIGILLDSLSTTTHQLEVAQNSTIYISYDSTAKTVYFYSTNSSYGPAQQMNASGTTYYYIAM